MKGFHLNGYTEGSHPQPQKLELYTKFISPCESTPAKISIGSNVWSLEAKKILDPIEGDTSIEIERPCSIHAMRRKTS